ncbi:carboxypeptidase-like regulatory domain-containing protein [Flagellimonas allohymeniacidonis]|uniref:Carboxypeptidase regulatory-like domain-containing protein n=1 Tax=Flagellimonas allohymeniacidonis TaxID=2517819 RepID=A0A4Q8QA77_9FLAO|nr:carboxypeptidase-like regulatory domain-containing protein [Allomuricauda hymeniacidonis]TAI47195.1 carboxypeptidase regulatory-like domain-containing protein [Allomuricauda hymeniacidonis]
MNFVKTNREPYRFPMLRTIEIGLILFLLTVGCSNSDSDSTDDIPDQQIPGTIVGVVSDPDGNVYPGASITASKGKEESTRVTNPLGEFKITTKSIGPHNVVLELPLSTEALSSTEISINVKEDQDARVDFVIQPKSVKAHLNFGDVQILEEIVDKDGNTPTSPSEPLYAANIFDPPLGLLTAIKAPDGHQITLEEFEKAEGKLDVHCNGDKSYINVALEGMIPNGTYTFWLAYLNKTRKVGEAIDFANDFVFRTNPPVGASNGTENIAVADENGTISLVFEHASCILTDEVALVIPILYHINGKTFGGGHVPDTEEMVHMLAYFQ